MTENIPQKYPKTTSPRSSEVLGHFFIGIFPSKKKMSDDAGTVPELFGHVPKLRICCVKNFHDEIA